RSRYYDAELGRFVSEDAAGFRGGPNLYAYVGGDPASVSDPTGQCPWCIAALVGGLAGGGFDLVIQLARNGWDFGCVDWGRVGISALTGAALSMLGPTGGLLGRGGAKAAQYGYSETAGLLNYGGGGKAATYFGWGWNGENTVLRGVINGSKFDI